MVVMIRTPAREKPAKKETRATIPGISLGARGDNVMGNRAVGYAQAIWD
jgi:hypothetical protein